MPSADSIEQLHQALEAFADRLTTKFSQPIEINPEDQLKAPIETLFEAAGAILGIPVEVVTEVQESDVQGRPDVGILSRGLLVGHIELKAPGKGANTKRYRGADRNQWNRFSDLPNLLYTDGNEWALYRTGERKGQLVRLGGDVTTDGADAVGEATARALLELIRDFLRWEPIVPRSPRALAEMLAPICRLLRQDVLEALEDESSRLSSLQGDWRRYLFPDADDAQFADAYAQTLTYAMLLARFSGGGQQASGLSVHEAAETIRTGHRLLADALRILSEGRREIEVPVNLLERIIGAVDVSALTRRSDGDPWLYFYEDFLAVYDPKMRGDRGVYYTPVPVIRAQVRLIAQLLEERFGAEHSFADPRVTTLDPAVGTGTYPLTGIEHALDKIEQTRGKGMRASAATVAARNVHGFEILVGPYAVAHLRLTQQILAEGGRVGDDGVHIYLTDTLESPNAPQMALPTMYRSLGEEHERAKRVKTETKIVVCFGNPPYDRQQISAEDAEHVRRKGGWVRYGDEVAGARVRPLLEDFLEPLERAGLGVHAKNLYNDYVYFWRWALWKVFESGPGGGIVSFITASSYLRGPGFAGMRQVMREGIVTRSAT